MRGQRDLAFATHNGATLTFNLYLPAHGVEIDEPVRLLFGAGQTGVAADGSVGKGIVDQAQLVWDNLREVLAAARMDITNIVQLNMLLINREDAPGAMQVRDEALGDHRPA